MSAFNKISLDRLFNHKLVYSGEPEQSDEIGIDDTYISKSDWQFGSGDPIDGVEFMFGADKYDNIECDGQELQIDDVADKLHIFGFAVWGDTFSTFKINYMDGEERYITVPFIDWSHAYSFNWFDMSSVGGDIKSHGLMASGAQTKPVYLHHIAVDLPRRDKIQSIILPDNFCLHIYAITSENTTTTSKEANK